MRTALTINQKTHLSSHENQNENFWKKHVAAFPDSGLTKAAYCRENLINYNRFFYWIKRLSRSQSAVADNNPCNGNKKNHASIKTMLLPVQLKQASDVWRQNRQGMHCTIDLKNGSTLHVHDQTSLLLILEKWS